MDGTATKQDEMVKKADPAIYPLPFKFTGKHSKSYRRNPLTQIEYVQKNEPKLNELNHLDIT